MSKRLSNKQPIKDVIAEWLSEHPKAKRVKETRIDHLWGELMGPSVKKRTTSVRFYSGKLFVKLDSSILKNELSFAKSQIVSNMNKELGQELIKELIFS